MPLRVRDWMDYARSQWRDIAVAAASFVCYLGTGHIQGMRPHEIPELELDRQIPLLPWTSYGYVSLYPLLLANLFYLVPHPRALRPLMQAITLANAVGGIIFVSYRTTAPRPPLPRTTGWRVLAWVWGVDPPYNALPSLHTAYGVLIAWAHIKLRSPYLPLVLPWSAIVIATTLTTKQHRVLDVVGGIGLAAPIGWVLLRHVSPGLLNTQQACDTTS